MIPGKVYDRSKLEKISDFLVLNLDAYNVKKIKKCKFSERQGIVLFNYFDKIEKTVS